MQERVPNRQSLIHKRNLRGGTPGDQPRMTSPSVSPITCSVNHRRFTAAPRRNRIGRGTRPGKGDDVVVAALYDQVGKVKYAGSLTVTNFDKGGYRLITQSSPGVPGSPKAHARFGRSIGVRSDSARTSALLVSTCGFDRPDSDDCGVVQARSTMLDSWSSLWPSTTGFVHGVAASSVCRPVTASRPEGTAAVRWRPHARGSPGRRPAPWLDRTDRW